MILLNEITIKNFLSHEKTNVKFEENDKFLIDGKSGSGKSTITEALLWSLYGKGRSDNKSLIRKGSKIASVSLKLNEGELETIITRSVSQAGKNTLTVTQNTGSKKQFIAIDRTGIKDHQAWIENELLKASFELFVNSIVYQQENENSFVKANAVQRKDLLLEIVRAGNFDDLYKKARIAIGNNEIEFAVSNSKIDSLELSIKEAEEETSKIDLYAKEATESTGKIEILKKQEKSLEKKLEGISDISQKLIEKKASKIMIESSLRTIDEQIESDNLTKEKHDKLDIKQAKLDIKKAEELLLTSTNIEKKIKENSDNQMKINAHLSNKPVVVDYTDDIKIINERLIPLIRDSGSCPSGEKCPFVVPIKGQITFLAGQIEEKTQKTKVQKESEVFWEKQYVELVPVEATDKLYTELQELKNEIEKLNESKQTIIFHESLKDTLSDIKSREEKFLIEIPKIKTNLINIDKEIKLIEDNVKAFDSNSINSELSTLRIELIELQNIKDSASANLLIATKAQITLKNASKDILELRKGLSKAIKDKKSLELLKEALSPRGVKAVVIDYVIPQLEDKINVVLSQMSEFSIRLDTQKAKAKEDDGIKEGLFITIINERSEELSFENYSGGERVKITIAISEALASLMNSIGFRIMDENIISLDKESTEGFVDVLINLQEKFPQLLIISHLQEVKDLFEKQITIIKDNGISKII